MTRDEAVGLLDPELSAYLDRPSDDLGSVPLSIARDNANAVFAAMGGPPTNPPEVVVIPGHKGQPDVEVRVHRPVGVMPNMAVLHVHGGGMVKGSAWALDARIASVAQFIGSIVVSVEYRLAPETPFPGPMLDCVAGWNWMITQAPSWGIAPSACVIAGDSAGGGLAAATTFYLRDTGAIMPAGQVLVFPMLDYQTGLGDLEHTDSRLGWNSANNQFGWRALLGDQPLPTGHALAHFSPAHAISFKDLPPTWIGVGTIDLFLDENIAFAGAIARAGGTVTLRTYKGAPHGFQMIPSRVSSQFFTDYKAAFAAMVSS
jgi:acetyl esterase